MHVMVVCGRCRADCDCGGWSGPLARQIVAPGTSWFVCGCCELSQTVTISLSDLFEAQQQVRVRRRERSGPVAS